MQPKAKSQVIISIDRCEGYGIDPEVVVNALNKMKAELEAQNCYVSLTVNGLPPGTFFVALEPEKEPVT